MLSSLTMTISTAYSPKSHIANSYAVPKGRAAKIPATLLGAHPPPAFDPHFNWAASWEPPRPFKHRSL